MATKAQLYLNELGDQREFAERLAAKDAEIERLSAIRDECMRLGARRGREIARLREALKPFVELADKARAALKG